MLILQLTSDKTNSTSPSFTKSNCGLYFCLRKLLCIACICELLIILHRQIDERLRYYGEDDRSGYEHSAYQHVFRVKRRECGNHKDAAPRREELQRAYGQKLPLGSRHPTFWTEDTDGTHCWRKLFNIIIVLYTQTQWRSQGFGQGRNNEAILVMVVASTNKK